MRFFHNKNKTNCLTVDAFSFVEMGIILLVIGILIGAVFKGKDLIDIAKGHAVVNEIYTIQHEIEQYKEHYHALPGDDKNADRFGSDVKNGDGNHKIEGDESKLAWVHLFKAGLSNTDKEPSTKFGGIYSLSTDDQNNHWLTLSNANDGGLLTPKQAMHLKSKLKGGDASENDNSVLILNGKDAKTPCINNQNINFATQDSVCIVRVRLSS